MIYAQLSGPNAWICRAFSDAIREAVGQGPDYATKLLPKLVQKNRDHPPAKRATVKLHVLGLSEMRQLQKYAASRCWGHHMDDATGVTPATGWSWVSRRENAVPGGLLVGFGSSATAV